MAQPNFGAILTSGIQDISAFLPILGSDQCETHIGAALEGGFLYAAAAPLSIFGCLGIVKAGVSILFASFQYRRFHGAQILRNAGFELKGSAATMIGVSTRDLGPNDNISYVACTRLEVFMKDQHVEH
ncbi:hypothetical protein C8F04DRAFT_955307, partial [Mycena alexandri]